MRNSFVPEFHPTPPQLQYEMHPAGWVGSVHVNMAEGTSTTGSKKAVPDTVVELVNVAIYTFGCQSGLRLSHKIWGDPVLEGVACFLGQLLQTSNPETQEMFATISPDRFGGWTPGERPSKQLVTFISSRMKTLKNKQALREDENPQVPSRLVETWEIYDGHEERVVTRYRPLCWRCGQRCDFCRQQKKNYPTFGNFRVE